MHADCIEDSYAATEHQCAAQKSAQARPQYSMNVLVIIITSVQQVIMPRGGATAYGSSVCLSLRLLHQFCGAR